MQIKPRIVHLMSNDKFGKPFVDFLNKNFNKEEHIVLCKRFFKEFPFPEGENVIEITSYKEYPLDAPYIEKIICHSLFDEERVHYLYNNKELLQNKAYWQIWGGDVYDAPNDSMNTFVRANFKGYISLFDEEYTQRKYGIEKEFYKAGYPSPFMGLKIGQIKKESPKHDALHIQINNSADISTIEMLEMLKKFRKENMKIYTVLSYGQMKQKDAILQKGKEIFGQKFIPLLKYLNPEEYAKHLATIDVLILHQQRQQAGANAYYAVSFGSKLFIHEKNTVGTKLKNDGLHIYNSNDIAHMDFEEFKNYIYQDENILCLRDSVKNRGTVLDLWQKIFDA